VPSTRGLGLSGKAIREVMPDKVARLIRDADTADSEAIFVSCTDFRALEVVDSLERELRKPILTSNQVTLWGVLRALGRTTSVPGYGRLLA
jgi:maleate isomerase